MCFLLKNIWLRVLKMDKEVLVVYSDMDFDKINILLKGGFIVRN